jgi:hypothetical protein
MHEAYCLGLELGREQTPSALRYLGLMDTSIMTGEGWEMSTKTGEAYSGSPSRSGLARYRVFITCAPGAERLGGDIRTLPARTLANVQREPDAAGSADRTPMRAAREAAWLRVL